MVANQFKVYDFNTEKINVEKALKFFNSATFDDKTKAILIIHGLMSFACQKGDEDFIYKFAKKLNVEIKETFISTEEEENQFKFKGF